MTTARRLVTLTITQSPAMAHYQRAHGDQQVVAITVTDEAGNSTTCEVTLTLVDDENPTIIECVEDHLVASTPDGMGNCTGLVPNMVSQLAVDDNCTDAASLIMRVQPGAGYALRQQRWRPAGGDLHRDGWSRQQRKLPGYHHAVRRRAAHHPGARPIRTSLQMTIAKALSLT